MFSVSVAYLLNYTWRKKKKKDLNYLLSKIATILCFVTKQYVIPLTSFAATKMMGPDMKALLLQVE